jgi:hypothetical protein
MKTILLALLTFASAISFIASDSQIHKMDFGAKLNPYRAYPESKQFSFFTDITINDSTNTAKVIVTSYEDMGIAPCNFEDEILEQIKSHVASYLKDYKVKTFFLTITHPNGAQMSGNFDVDTLALRGDRWQGIYCVEYKSVNY